MNPKLISTFIKFNHYYPPLLLFKFFLLSVLFSNYCSGQSWESIPLAPGLNQMAAYQCVAGGNYLYAGDQYGDNFYRYDGSTWQSIPLAPGLIQMDAQKCVAGGNYLYAQDQFGDNFYRFDGSSWQSIPLAPGLNQMAAYQCVAGGNYLYAGDQYGDNFYRYDGVSWQSIPLAPGLNQMDAQKCVAGGNTLYAQDQFGDNFYRYSEVIVLPPTAFDQTFCAGVVVSDLVATGTDLQWYDVSTGGAALLLNTTLVAGNYYVSQTVSGVESERTLIEVTILTPITYYADADGDGYGNAAILQLSCIQPSGYVLNNDDCDDTNNTVYPGAAEICYDGLDNDCDGTIDNGCTPIVSVVLPNQCGTTLPFVNSYVYAALVPGAQGYRFRVTNMTTNEVQTIDRFLRQFRITQLSNYAFNTTYTVEVSVRINNVWQPFYGTPCTITTPDTTTQIQASQCNTTMNNINNAIFANIVPFATGYRFRITNSLDQTDVQTSDRVIRDLRLNNLPNIQYNTTYNVEVAVRNTDGSYLSYGSLCTITTPLFPTVGLQDAQCDEYQVTSNTTTLFAASYPGAQQYRFLLENESQSYSQTFDRPLRTVTLNNFTGLLPGTTYTVRVAIRLNGVWGPYGKSCTIITPGAGRSDQVTRMDENYVNEFKAIAYPNPFTTSFAIDVKTSNTETVSLAVYDMTGRLLEVKEVKAQDTTNYQFGDCYPSGVYNVIVTQGEEKRTVLVVKQ
jgi:hypothetical protein